MRIGIDLDNTLVSYDALFPRLAEERGLVTPPAPPTKQALRDYLRAVGREDAWTELQGLTYGPAMQYAEPFPGALEFLAACHRHGHSWRIISHRSRVPYRGEPYDLHQAARHWLAARLPGGEGSTTAVLQLEATREGKLRAIAEFGCEVFIDDLPELLSDPAFPAGVRRILFDPGQQNPPSPWYERATSWIEVNQLLGIETAPPSDGAAEDEPAEIPLDVEDPTQRLAVAQLLPGSPDVAELRLRRCRGGRNNRLDQLQVRGDSWAWKRYFRAPSDSRDRRRTEWDFLNFCWDRGLRQVPRPVATDPANGWSIFSWVPGRKLHPAEVTSAHVAEAIELLNALNAHRDHPEATRLPTASESCFSLDEHIQCVARRVQRLAESRAVWGPENPRSRFVEERLWPAWEQVQAELKPAAASASANRLLAEGERILSPSDFGFHNALLGPDGRLTFLDFEYAGWDDPAKTVCDFFAQVEVPAPPTAWDCFTTALAEWSGPAVRERAALIRPLYRLKWCCIVLNPWLPPGQDRRKFSGAERAVPGSAEDQEILQRATRLLTAGEVH